MGGYVIFVYIGAVAIILLGVVLRVLRRERKVDRKACLTVRSGSRAGVRLRLQKARTLVGAQDDNDLVLTDDRISRHHLQVTYENGVFIAADLNSLYGTFVGETRIEKWELASGMILNLGKVVELEFSIVD